MILVLVMVLILKICLEITEFQFRKCMLKAYELNGDMLKYNLFIKIDEFWNDPKELKSKYHELKNNMIRKVIL